MNNEADPGNILIVDDDPTNLQLLGNMLQELGYTIRPATNGIQALDAVRLNAPDLILLDIMMPDMDGYHVCAELKADEMLRDIPVIFISALNEPFDKLRAFESGAQDYVTKPLHVQEVIARVRTHIENAKLHQRERRHIEQLQQHIKQLEQAEQTLRQSEARNRALLAAIPDAIFHVSGNGVFVDHEVAEEFELFEPPHKFIGHTVEEVMPPEIAGEILRGLRTVLETGEMQSVEYSLMLDDAVRDYEARLIAYGKDDLLAIVRDVTERNQVKQQAFRLAVEQERVKVLTNFITNASHEFRTPLSVIGIRAYTLAKTTEPTRRQNDLQIINDQINNLTKLLSDLTFMARLDGRTEFKLQRLNLNNLIRAVCSTIYGKTQKRSIVLNLDLDDDVAPISGDKDQLQLAFSKLLDNAERYTFSEGEITVRTYCQDENAIVEIRDTGIGITEEQLSRLFERFYRVDEVHSTRGFGLGLPIAQRIIELHHGQIEVESVLGSGSMFRVLLPLNAHWPHNPQKLLHERNQR